MRVLVTGANGFVGAMLCRKLIERGDQVVGLVRETSDLSLLESIPIIKVIGRLDDTASLKKAVHNIQVVYHVAAAVSDWGSLEYFRKINVEWTQYLLQTSKEAGVRRFVFVSSVAVHAFLGIEDMDENAPQQPNPFPYGRSKQEAEVLVLSYNTLPDFETTIVRPGDVFGPGDRTSLLKMKDMLLKGQMLLLDHGRTLGAFTYVENLVDGIILAGNHPKAPGEAFIITDGIKLTWKSYFKRLTEALDLPEPKGSIPGWLAQLIAELLEFIYKTFRLKRRPPVTKYLIAHLRHDVHFSIHKAENRLGYHPNVPIENAIRRTAEWFKKSCM